ncbi:hypothetical protein PENSTE_c005G02951 [Penicillium steckii]|uniref:Protein kinase domain-containing protein n=1 Tax=Penicillium steckii TaxID=303698 RepID=A0A1V6TKY4_9EURO|nr:hypothetical protein PENSTE_c005G02951 [Penicillium steckii]
MEVAGIALASASAARELFVCGRRIYHRIRDEKKLILVLREFQMFDLEDRRAQLEIDIALAQGILKSRTVDQEHKDRLERNWKNITSLLGQVDRLIDEMIQNSSWTATRARHEARDKLLDLGGTKVISNAVQEFQSIVLALRELEKDQSPLYLSPNDFQLMDVSNRVFNSSRDAFFGKGRLTDPLPGIPNTPQWFLFESKPYERQNPDSKEVVKENIRMDDMQSSTFHLIFACLFTGSYPDTLESYLKMNTNRPSLNFRVNLCSQLATAVLQTMTLTLVHKNIRPENILLLPTENTVGAMGGNTPGVFLTGWQYARQVERSVSFFKGETTLQRKIYQHPERQLVEAEKEYSMAHDVYSLGVCMIEILTWESLLPVSEPPTVSESFISTFESLGLRKDVSGIYTKNADQIKQTLVAICDRNISIVAGEKIALLIKEFLTCLDDDEEDEETDEEERQYQTPANDKARREVAVHFVDNALKTLRDIQGAI